MSDTMTRHRSFLLIFRPLLAAILAAACNMVAASPDEDKLRLLSCATPNEARDAHKQAVDWFNRTAATLGRDAGQRIAGPVTLGKACLQNIVIAGGFGAVMIQGDICNARLEDFTDTLATAGIVLDKDPDPRIPATVVGTVGKDGRYLVTEGRMDPRTGKVSPGATPYSFTCMAAFGGPQ